MKINSDMAESLRRVYVKLGRLNDQKEEMHLNGSSKEQVNLVEQQMKELRKLAEEILNSPCPIVKL